MAIEGYLRLATKACKYERMGLNVWNCCHLHLEKLYEDSFKWLLGLYPTTIDIPNIRRFRYPAMTSNILLTFMATIGAWLRLCALLHSEPQQQCNQAFPKKDRFLQETGFTNMGPCNLYIYVYIFINIYIYIVYIFLVYI